jgi:hypothetical protein
MFSDDLVSFVKCGVVGVECLLFFASVLT